MSTIFYFVRPTDSLFVRGNMAFGDGGAHGSSMMPPPPSLFAGAFRSALLAHDPNQLAAFQRGYPCPNPALARCLGTYATPGAFRLTWLTLAGETADKTASTSIEAVSPFPADLMLLNKSFTSLQPRALLQGLQSAGDLPLRATLVTAKQEKPQGGALLRGSGLERHLQSGPLSEGDAISSKHLYLRDPRLGIGLNADARTAEDGQIYTTEGFAFSPQRIDVQKSESSNHFASTGFLVGLEGVADVLPPEGTLRLGGDGRSAHYSRIAFSAPAVPAISNGQFRLLLQTPAVFTQGWLPEGVTLHTGHNRLQGEGFSARLVCAALGRREIVSGWDMHLWAPKPAQAAAPAGSVYWFDQFEGDVGKLAAWVQRGLWPDHLDTQQQTRRAEGYNRALLGAWL